MPLRGNSCWASFQNKKDLDEQRFMGYFFSGFGNIPKHAEKACSKPLFTGHKLYLPKARSYSQAQTSTGQVSRSICTSLGQVGPKTCLLPSSPNVPLEAGEAEVCLSLHFDAPLGFHISLFLGMSALPSCPLLLSKFSSNSKV